MLLRNSDAEAFRQASVQALVLLGLAVLATGLITYLYYARLPYAGFEFSGATVGAVVPSGPAEAAGLRVGDHVLAVEGQPVRAGTAYLRPGQKVLRLSVERDGQVLPVELAMRAPSAKESLYVRGHFLVGLAFWLLAMAVLLLRPRGEPSRFFIMTTLLAAAALFLWSIADLGLAWANVLMTAIVAALGPLFVHYCTVFPEQIDFRGRRAVLTTLYAATSLLVALSTTWDVMAYGGLDLGGKEPPSLAPVIEAFFSLCVLAGLVLLIRAAWASASAAGKRGARVILLGTALALVPLVSLIALPQVFSAPYLVPTWLTLPLLLFIPLSYTYATFRGDLTPLDGAVNRSVVSYLLTWAFAALYVLLYLAAQKAAPGWRAGSTVLPCAGLILGAVFLLEPAKRGTQSLVDKALYGGWYEYQGLVSRLSEELKEAQSAGKIAGLLVGELAGGMHLASAALLLPGTEHTFCACEPHTFAKLPCLQREGALPAALLGAGAPVLHERLRSGLRVDPASERELADWAEAGARVWAPLVQQGTLVGVLVVGSKMGDDFFHKKDLQIVTTVAQQAAAAVVRVQLMDELRGQVEEVQALARQLLALLEMNHQRMAVELHDRVLQDLFVARNLLEEAEEEFQPDKIAKSREILLEMAGYLRSVVLELRPPKLNGGKLRELLEDYVVTVAQKRGLPVSFEALGEGADEQIPEPVRVALYRILQESLNNARKHAQAEEVLVILDVQPDSVVLEVNDDGIGFDPPTYLGKLVDRNHLGLVSMRERAAEVGGEYRVESEPGRGTRVVVEVPLPEA